MKQNQHHGLNGRQQMMLEQISREGELRIAALKASYPVTEMTIRRDLEKLEETGMIKRTFGGAIFIGKDIALQERAHILTEEKARIGRHAAGLIQAGESIFIDGGTTTLQVAKFIPAGLKIMVVTNALNVAAELSGKQIPVIVTGGSLVEATHSLVGPIAAQSLGSMAFDRVFLGTTGFNFKHGFSNSNMYEAEIKQIAIRQASESTIVLDHTKFGASMLVSFATLSGIDRIVTDQWPDDELKLACRKANVVLEVAE